jgi:hypothetical protein
MIMKRISIYFCVLSVMLSVYSCDGMYDSINDFVAEERVYPGGFDRADGLIGYERVEINLLDTGRIPAAEIKLGKAKKTVIEYDKEVIVIDSLCSWVNIEGLTLSKLYRFTIYTVDEYGDKSIPVEGTAIPYTAGDLTTLALPEPRSRSLTENSMEISWPSMSSILLDYYRMTYSYVDKDNQKREGSSEGENPVIILDNLAMGQQVKLEWQCRIIPRVNNVPIIDSIWWERPPLTFEMTAIPVRDITLSTTSLKLYIGNQATVRASTVPGNATESTITWRSENPAIATVSDDGTVTGVSVGTTTLTAAAGAIEKTISVSVENPAFNGPHILSAAAPYQLEAKDFDYGGEGFAFHEVTGNTYNNTYRTERGDYLSSTVGMGGGGNIRHTNDGEWLAYTIEVQDAGVYAVDVQLSSGHNAGASYSFAFDEEVSERIASPNQNSWDSWTWIFDTYTNLPQPTFRLSKGIHKFKFIIGPGGFDLMRFRFTYVGD